MLHLLKVKLDICAATRCATMSVYRLPSCVHH